MMRPSSKNDSLPSRYSVSESFWKRSDPKQIAENVLAFVRTLKTNKMTCEHSEVSDQPWHLPSLIRVFTVRGSLAPHRAPNEDSDQTGQMPRLI